jgi:hypothetical protein
MRRKLLLLLAWLVVGSGGCLTGVSLQTAALPSAPLGAVAAAQEHCGEERVRCVSPKATSYP